MAGELVVELCVGSAADVHVAREAGADRAELCAGLVEGGITPSAGTIRAARAVEGIGLMVMVRPRGGDFLYSALERQVMADDVARAAELGADGVVFGLLHEDGTVDAEATGRLVALARPMQVCFHRAFDMTRDPVAALEALVSVGVDRVLTSGQQASAAAAVPLLRRLVEQAGDRITVMPGGGLVAGGLAAVVRGTGAREVHFAALATEDGPMRHRNPRPFMGAGDVPGEYERTRTVPDLAARMVAEARGA